MIKLSHFVQKLRYVNDSQSFNTTAAQLINLSLFIADIKLQGNCLCITCM